MHPARNLSFPTPFNQRNIFGNSNSFILKLSSEGTSFFAPNQEKLNHIASCRKWMFLIVQVCISKNQGKYRLAPPFAINDYGIPLCPKGFPMAFWGFEKDRNRLKWRCSKVAGSKKVKALSTLNPMMICVCLLKLLANPKPGRISLKKEAVRSVLLNG
jgi:hypothetical protein